MSMQSICYVVLSCLECRTQAFSTRLGKNRHQVSVAAETTTMQARSTENKNEKFLRLREFRYLIFLRWDLPILLFLITFGKSFLFKPQHRETISWHGICPAFMYIYGYQRVPFIYDITWVGKCNVLITFNIARYQRFAISRRCILVWEQQWEFC